MKKILMVVASIATVSLSSFGQGTFNMVYYDAANGISVGAQHNQHTTGWLLGSEYSAQAYMLAGGSSATPEGSLAAVAATLTSFNLNGATVAGGTAANGSGQFYEVSSIVTAFATGNAAIQIRAWFNGGLYSTYEAALAAGANTGKSAVLTINLQASNVPSQADLNSSGMQPFTVGAGAVPEPSPIALAGLGAASLLMFRRRK